MFKIQAAEQFQELVKEYKTVHKRPDTNCYFMPEEIEAYVKREKLYGSIQGNILYFLIDEEKFYRLYFYLGKEIPAFFEPLDKPVVLDFVYRGETAGEKQQVLYRKFEACGFAEYKTYCRMNLKLKQAEQRTEQFSESTEGFFIENRETKYASDIVELWEKQLDIYSTPLPSADEVKSNIEVGNLYYIVDDRQQLSAALQWSIRGSSCYIEHVAVCPTKRRNGLGGILLSKAVKGMKEQVISQWVLWVDIKNEPALNLYRKCGFAEDTMVSKQFIYKL